MDLGKCPEVPSHGRFKLVGNMCAGHYSAWLRSVAGRRLSHVFFQVPSLKIWHDELMVKMLIPNDFPVCWCSSPGWRSMHSSIAGTDCKSPSSRKLCRNVRDVPWNWCVALCHKPRCQTIVSGDAGSRNIPVLCFLGGGVAAAAFVFLCFSPHWRVFFVFSAVSAPSFSSSSRLSSQKSSHTHHSLSHSHTHTSLTITHTHTSLAHITLSHTHLSHTHHSHTHITHTHANTQSLSHSLTHALTHPPTHSLARSLTHTHHSPTHTHTSFTHTHAHIIHPHTHTSLTHTHTHHAHTHKHTHIIIIIIHTRTHHSHTHTHIPHTHTSLTHTHTHYSHTQRHHWHAHTHTSLTHTHRLGCRWFLRGRRGTWCTAKGSDVRPGAPVSLWRPLVSAALPVAFAWQAWHLVHCKGVGCTPWCPSGVSLASLGLRRSAAGGFCVAGVRLGALQRGRR